LENELAALEAEVRVLVCCVFLDFIFKHANETSGKRNEKAKHNLHGYGATIIHVIFFYMRTYQFGMCHLLNSINNDQAVTVG
jgi:hypothetical protein